MIFSSLIEKYSRQTANNDLWNKKSLSEIKTYSAFKLCKKHENRETLDDVAHFEYLKNGDFGYYNLELVEMLSCVWKKRAGVYSEEEIVKIQPKKEDELLSMDMSVFEIWFSCADLGMTSVTVLSTDQGHAEDYAKAKIDTNPVLRGNCSIEIGIKLCSVKEVVCYTKFGEIEKICVTGKTSSGGIIKISPGHCPVLPKDHIKRKGRAGCKSLTA